MIRVTPPLASLPPAPTGQTGWPWTASAPAPPPTLSNGQPWPRITLVTPSYNQGAFIEATLRSVALQGYPNLEHIVMDAGSTDHSVDIIQRYAPWLSDWVSEPDRGQSHALNKGFTRATGEIFGWLNSDDLLLPGALATIGAAFAAHPEAVLVHGQAHNIDAAGQLLEHHPHAGAYDRRWLLEESNLIPQPAAFFRRTLYDSTQGLDESLHYTMDWDLWLRLERADQAVYLPRVLALMRAYPEAKSYAGGRKIHAELRRMLARHGGQNLPATVVRGLVRIHWAKACSAYAGGDLAAGRDELAYVLAHAPEWRADTRRLARQISDHAWHWLRQGEAGDQAALRFAEAVCGHLPEGVPFPAALRRYTLALLYEGLAFRARTRGEPATARRWAWQAMRLDTRCLANRGLWSLLLRAGPAAGSGQA